MALHAWALQGLLVKHDFLAEAGPEVLDSLHPAKTSSSGLPLSKMISLGFCQIFFISRVPPSIQTCSWSRNQAPGLRGPAAIALFPQNSALA